MLTETDPTGQKASCRNGARMPTRRRKTIDPLTLEAGDYIPFWAAHVRVPSLGTHALPEATAGQVRLGSPL